VELYGLSIISGLKIENVDFARYDGEIEKVISKIDVNELYALI
jgi:hypothetical protein